MVAHIFHSHNLIIHNRILLWILVAIPGPQGVLDLFDVLAYQKKSE